MDTGLKGKTVLLSGASGGIGSDIARYFDREGSRLERINTAESIFWLPVPVSGLKQKMSRTELWKNGTEYSR